MGIIHELHKKGIVMKEMHSFMSVKKVEAKLLKKDIQGSHRFMGQ